jgi:hypothetical protein
MSKEGKGRNQIVYELAQINIKASSGSVSNILKEYKESQNKEQLAPPEINEQHETPVNTQLQMSTDTSPMFTPVYTPSIENEDFLHLPNVDFSDIAYQENYPNDLEEQINQIHNFEITKDTLQKQIEENRMILKADKKAAENFSVVKTEMTKAGIELTDLSGFLGVMTAFRKYNYDCGNILMAFSDIQDIVIERKNIERLKAEARNNQKAFQKMLDTLGVNLDGLKKLFVSLMSLEQQGISLDEIVNLSRTVSNHLNQIRRQNWERNAQDGWAQDVNVNNEGGGQDYDQGYGYGYGY